MDQLKQIQCRTITLGVAKAPVFHNKAISFFCFNKSGDMDHALKLFDQIPEPKSVYLWNTMIKGYSRIDSPKHGISMYLNMLRQNVKPDNYTFPFLLKGFHRNVGFSCGKQLHYHVVNFGLCSNVFVQNALIHMYSLCGQMEIARRAFHITDLEACKQIHNYIERCEIEPKLILDNALIDMYATCGEMGVAVAIFDRMKTGDVISWTTMVSGFINKGDIDLARSYFDQMPERMQESNIRPDEYTMVSILTACAHLGALQIGEWIKIYIVRNKVKNDVGNALIDMYSKCGSIVKARRVFSDMPRKENFTWTAMIVGLAINGHAEEALGMFYEMLKASINPDEITYIGVFCAGSHAGMVERDIYEKIAREPIMQRGIKKTPGCSLIEMNRIVHEFVAGDRSHPQSKEIFLKLDSMTGDLKVAGYSPDTSKVFLDIGEDKESTLYRHSEKLAAFGLVSSEPLRIVKNLRLCVDCHVVAKLVSKLYDREVIVRD
ncbi:F6D8.25 [Hibiscus syriacus]|uniref:F6D8.25 n=1 Tax=Hibiscus syriacus TaxID=106335 RepID=A0A6A3AZG3_HIBSY|nr:F6D8.25 [Hibiscus syriacus]